MKQIRVEVTFATEETLTTARYRIEQAAKDMKPEGCTVVGEPRIVTVKERKAEKSA